MYRLITLEVYRYLLQNNFLTIYVTMSFFAPDYVDSLMDSVIRISQNEDIDTTPLQAEPPPLFKARQRWGSYCPHDTFQKPVTLTLLLKRVSTLQCWPMKPSIVNRGKKLSHFVHNKRRKLHTKVRPQICPIPAHKLSVGSVPVPSEMETIETVEPGWYTLLFGLVPDLNWCR